MESPTPGISDGSDGLDSILELSTWTVVFKAKTFQKPMKEGIALFHAIQDVYLNKEITVA